MTPSIEPECTVIKYAEIPAKKPVPTERYFWESVAERIRLLATDEALRIDLPDGSIPRVASVHKAAKRIGLRVGTSAAGSTVYIWRVGKCVATGPGPIKTHCDVCGRSINRARAARIQNVCSNPGSVRKTYCQRMRDRARRRKISVEEYIRTRSKLQQHWRTEVATNAIFDA